MWIPKALGRGLKVAHDKKRLVLFNLFARISHKIVGINLKNVSS